MDPFKTVFLQEYKRFDDFDRELGRLQTFISFTLAMPAITSEDAINAFVNDPGNGLKEGSADVRQNLKEAYRVYDETFSDCQREFLKEVQVVEVVKDSPQTFRDERGSPTIALCRC